MEPDEAGRPGSGIAELALEASGAAVAVSGPSLALTWVNDAFLRLWGYDRREEVLGRLATEFWSDEAAAADVARAVGWDGRWTGELEGKRADGRRFTARVSVRLHRDAAGASPAIVATFVDVSDLRDVEEQLHQAQKMEAMGLLAGGVAHDFNNLLTIILTAGAFLEEGLAPGDARRADLEQILSAGRRAEALTRQLLAFSRRQALQPVLVDVNRAVLGFHRLVQRVIGEDVALSVTLAERLPAVLADGALLEQALMNLVNNARDAMPEGGRLDLSTSERTLDAEEARALELEPGRYVAVTVVDSGHGMDEATRARVFEPFFTTKPGGRGTGLGLATVQRIVRQGGGAVEVRSRPGAGSSFTMLFPARVEPAPEPVEERRLTAGRPAAKGPIVLVAEDEPAVRAVAERCLSQRGYRVRGAPDGEAALALARTMPWIDLLLTDVVMPGMNGRQLAEALRAVHPRTRVLFMTGYTDDVALRLGIEAHEVQLLAKPFTPGGLAEAVERALASGAPRVKTPP